MERRWRYVLFRDCRKWEIDRAQLGKLVLTSQKEQGKGYLPA